jgi:hypothetical protein
MSFELRPLAMGELLDRSFSIYRRHPVLFIGIMAVPALFALAMGLGVTAATTGQPGFEGRGLDPTQPPQMPSVGLIVGLVAGYFLFMVVYSVVYSLSLGATAVAVSELYLGRVSTIRSAYAHVRPQLGRLLLLGLLLFLRIVGIGFAIVAVVGVVSGVFMLIVAQAGTAGQVLALFGMLFMMLGFVVAFGVVAFISLRYALAVPILVLEQTRANAAIKRSVALTQGHLGRTFLLILCAMVLTYAGLAIFQVPFTVGANIAGLGTPAGFWLSMAGVVSGTIGGTLTSPVMIIGLAVLYYDLRVRKEALDVQMMMLALDAGDRVVALGSAVTPLPTDPAA